jgi:hypothetical protein
MKKQVILALAVAFLALAFIQPAFALVAFGLVAFAFQPRYIGRGVNYGATLTATEILSDVMGPFKQFLPMLNSFSTRLTAEKVALNGSLIGHIRTLPTASTYDAAQGGYKNGATSAAGLLTDIPITVDQHPHVPIKITHLTNIAAQKNVYQDNIADAAYVLAKAVLQNVLAKVVAANVSQKTTEAIVETDRDTLGGIRKAMNLLAGGSFPRAGIVNSDVFESLDADPRIASRDYYGQQTGGSPLGHLVNVAGFRDIWEYPDMPANAENLSGFFFDPRAVALVTGLPDHNDQLARALGLPTVMKTEVVTDPETGLSFMGLMWQEQGTLDIYMTVTLLFGSVVGKQAVGNAAGVATDYAGHRLVTG